MEHHVVVADVEADTTRQPVDRALERPILEWRDAAAAVADQVVVMLAVWMSRPPFT